MQKPRLTQVNPAAFLLLFGLNASGNPDIAFRIDLEKKSFHMGETIVLAMSFSSTVPNRYHLEMRTQDRIGRENATERLLLTPAEGAVDPLRDYFHGEPAGMGGIGSMATLSERPVTVRKDLNEWVRFDRAGVYRLTVESRRVYGAALLSNTVEFTILPPDPAWEAAQIPGASPRVLRFLNTPAAVRECVRRMGGSGVQADYEYKFCLLGTSHRSEAIQELEARFPASQQAVPPQFVEALAALRAWEKPGTSRPADEKALLDSLALAAASKVGAAKAICLKTLLEAGRPVPSGEIAASFRNLPAMEQSNLLQYRWAQIAGPPMLPVVRAIYENPPEPQYDPPIRDIALRRLYELDPAAGRRLILAEMTRPAPRLRPDVLTLLPDQTLPGVEGAIMDNLERDGDRGLLEVLLARYGTRAVLARAKAFYARLDAEMRARPTDAWKLTSPPVHSLSAPAVEPPLIAYFLRVAPAFGEAKLRQALAERWAEAGLAYRWVLGAVGRLYRCPEWEQVAIETLADPLVTVKMDAASALGRYGSAAARKPLLECFRYWHTWWKDRPAEMNDENRYFERQLALSLARAGGWLSDRAFLDEIAAQCITPACRQEIQGCVQQWTQPLQVHVGRDVAGEWHFDFAQYNLTSPEAFRALWAQLPPGTPVICRTLPGQEDLCRMIPSK